MGGGGGGQSIRWVLRMHIWRIGGGGGGGGVRANSNPSERYCGCRSTEYPAPLNTLLTDDVHLEDGGGGGGGGVKAYSACVESTNRILISSHHKINPKNEHTRANLMNLPITTLFRMRSKPTNG